jgi:hypothetical protein
MHRIQNAKRRRNSAASQVKANTRLLRWKVALRVSEDVEMGLLKLEATVVIEYLDTESNRFC